jgi:cbb3-type cytochrome oxidase maturation protein
VNIILLLIPISLVLLALGVWAFFWAVNHSQFDDLDTPGLSPLASDELVMPEPVSSGKTPGRDQPTS